MNTIYTVTLNPALDYTIHCDEIVMGQVNRTNYEQFFAGGKGINISLVLKTFDIPTTAMGFVGGFTGDEVVRQLENSGICTNFFRTNGGLTRINVKLKEKQETEINAGGPIVTEEEVKRLKNQLNAIGSNDFLVLAGSIPKCMPTDIYMQIMQQLEDKHIKIAVDAEGEKLTSVLKYHPFIIKPNHHELGAIFGENITTKKTALKYAKKLVEMGACNVIVSMAGDGAIFVNDNISLVATAPKGRVKNSVGAGDSMLAGFLAGVYKQMPIEECFKLSVATGSAAAFSGNLGSYENAQKLLEQFEIKIINSY